jgi:hypothetical protein
MRRIDDTLSRPGQGVMVASIEVSAHAGFSDFFADQGGAGVGADTCADSTSGCHTLPLGGATNSQTVTVSTRPPCAG